MNRQERGWKLFSWSAGCCCTVRRGGARCPAESCKIVDLFNQGLWVEMVNDGQDAARGAKDIQMRKNRRDRCGPDLRATRAEKLAMAGELSAARKALENAAVANVRNLKALPRSPVPRGMMSRVPDRFFPLDEERFAQNVRKARRGAAGTV